ncbi:MAG: GNAT family N-acetyltransferase [Anaerolineae bacterium]|nr:GNAT family N-acetyltransferase [Anaerolineae bacterium]
MEPRYNNQADFTVRQATADDTIGIATLLRDLGWSEWIAAATPESVADQVERHLTLCQADDSHSVYVAETPTGEVAGYVSVHWLPYLIHQGPEGYISELFIKTSARGQGLGSLLLATVRQEAEQRGCARLNLINNRERESYTRQFYKKQGWEERPWAASFVYWLK